jgi:hypothetical protein
MRNFFDLKTLNSWVPLFTVIAGIMSLWPLLNYIYYGNASVVKVTSTVNRSLINFSRNSTADVTITYGGEQIRSPQLVTMRIEKLGKNPIESNDVRIPVTINFSEARLLRATVNETAPHGITASIESSNDKILIRFDLLNPNDSLI